MIILYHVHSDVNIALYFYLDIDIYILLFTRGYYDVTYLLYVRVLYNKFDQAKDAGRWLAGAVIDRKSTRLNSSHRR